MGLFSQMPEFRKDDWAGIPSDPLRETSTAESLDDAPLVDPSAIGLVGQTTSLVFPVAVPAPGAADATTGEPGGDPVPEGLTGADGLAGADGLVPTEQNED